MAAEVDREQGFIVVRRQIRSSDLWKSLRGDQRAVFMTLLLLANWKAAKARWRDQWYEVGRGELSHSIATVAEEAGVGVKVVRTTLAALMADDRPAGGNGPAIVERYPISGTGPGTGPRVLTIVNYEKYQDVPEQAGTASGTDPAQFGHGSGTDPAQREQDQPDQQEEPPPPSPSEAKVAAVDAKKVWEELQKQRAELDARGRLAHQLPPEHVMTATFPEWLSEARNAAGEPDADERILIAYGWYLADPNIKALGHPTSVFMRPSVYLPRLQPPIERISR